MDRDPLPPDELRRRRGRALRTAWVLVAVALLIYGAFILSGVFGGGA